jgi:exopolyphosphatase / guanosine-5'-triphosphate,3'-diphosphate pyrophosphatase
LKQDRVQVSGDAKGQQGEEQERSGAPGAAGHLYAALDLGTNNCRLLVARPAGDGFCVVDAFSRIVRLGEGLAASGRLSDAAMARTIEALKICARKIRRRGVSRIRAVATEACRRAANCDDFLGAVRRRTGIELEIISQNEEAALAICGCAPLIDPDIPDILLFDIGGGSTEICWLKAEPAGAIGDTPVVRRYGAAAQGPVELSLHAWLSVPIGVITLAERYGAERYGAERYGAERYGAERYGTGSCAADRWAGHADMAAAYRAMEAEMAAAVAVFAARHRVADAVAGGTIQMLGTSGTVTTLAGVHKDLLRYDRAAVDGSYLEMATVRALSARIAAMTYAERAAHPCIGPQRADLVIAGCAILSALCRLWPADRLRVADRGLREGMLYAMMHGVSAPRGHWGAGPEPVQPTVRPAGPAGLTAV